VTIVTGSVRREIYYLPGMGGRLDRGLGHGLLERGYSLMGRETVGDFKRLRFGDQVEAVKSDLLGRFWQPDGLVIANSYGGYLFLHAQLDLDAFPGRVLLLSPVIGQATHERLGVRFFHPRADVLGKVSLGGGFPRLANIEVHVGEEDWQAGPQALLDFCVALEMRVHVAPGQGHTLGIDYVGPVLDQWSRARTCRTVHGE
jgi:hypothetical protein